VKQAHVSARAVRESRRQLVYQLIRDAGVVELGDDLPSGVQVATLGEGNQPLRE
jgi:hypothetical protein